MGLKDIFKTKTDISQTVNVPVTTPMSGATSHHGRPEGLTYQQWGAQRAGETKASSTALTPALNVVVDVNKAEQLGDEAMRAARKAKIQAQIDVNKNNIDREQNKIEVLKQAIDDINNTIAEKQSEINRIKEGGGEKRLLATVHFWIGAAICVFLALYLFVFYSSATYSAFFRDSSTMGIGDAIFYPYAFRDAWATSIVEFLLILLLPVVFLGLGFLVHQYSRKQGAIKYIKIGVLYMITFIFDALIAYGIASQMYSPAGPEDPAILTMSMAFNEPDFWIVIFAGFIAYVIWGLVFDFTIDSYAEMKEGATTIKLLKQDIAAERDKINIKQDAINGCNDIKTNLENENKSLEAKLRETVVYDLATIRKALNDFFAGWISYMTLMGMSAADQTDAESQLNSVLSALDEQKIK